MKTADRISSIVCMLSAAGGAFAGCAAPDLATVHRAPPSAVVSFGQQVLFRSKVNPYLCMSAGAARRGSAVTLAYCDETPDMLWFPYAGGRGLGQSPGADQWRSVASKGLCLYDEQGLEGAEVRLAPCGLSRRPRMLWQSAGNPAAVRLRSSYSDQVQCVAADVPVAGEKVHLVPCVAAGLGASWRQHVLDPVSFKVCRSGRVREMNSDC